MEVNIKFAKVRQDAIIPSKSVENAGFDIYANFEEDYIEIGPHETKLIPTGIASACPNDYALVLFERGSTGSKGMARRAGIVDSSYRGEIFVGITNTNNETLYISKLNKEDLIAAEKHKLGGDVMATLFGAFTADYINDNAIVYPYSKAIAQILILPVPDTIVDVISYEDLKSIPSERGLGALGSSGK